MMGERRGSTREGVVMEEEEGEGEGEREEGDNGLPDEPLAIITAAGSKPELRRARDPTHPQNKAARASRS